MNQSTLNSSSNVPETKVILHTAIHRPYTHAYPHRNSRVLRTQSTKRQTELRTHCFNIFLFCASFGTTSRSLFFHFHLVVLLWQFRFFVFFFQFVNVRGRRVVYSTRLRRQQIQEINIQTQTFVVVVVANVWGIVVAIVIVREWSAKHLQLKLRHTIHTQRAKCHQWPDGQSHDEIGKIKEDQNTHTHRSASSSK